MKGDKTMKIIYYDGSVLECEEIYFASKDELIVDDIYSVPTVEVLRIERR